MKTILLKQTQPPRKANVFRILWIMLCCLWLVFKHSIITIFVTFFSKKDVRTKIDKTLFKFGRGFARVLRIDLSVEGDIKSKLEPGRPIIIMCNHASAFDIPLAYYVVPETIRMISKKELFKIPILSTAMKAGEIISIDRQNRKQAIKDLEVAKEKMRSGVRMWIFPEGTRSSDGVLQPLKKGGIRLAIDTNAIIIPVVMQDIHKILPNKEWFKMNIYQKVTVKIGQAIDCRELGTESRHQITEEVYNSMNEMLNQREQDHA